MLSLFLFAIQEAEIIVPIFHMEEPIKQELITNFPPGDLSLDYIHKLLIYENGHRAVPPTSETGLIKMA